MKDIVVRGAREHNLQNISVTLPRNKLVVITGLSGSGKSSLAFDTLYAEGQRRYVESLSAYARQFLSLMNKPDVDSIEGLSPAISIEQKTTSKNPRSTVGTVTEIYDYLRLLFARVGTPYCPVHHLPIKSRTPQQITAQIMNELAGRGIVLSPIVRQKKGTYQKVVADLNNEGYTKVRIDGKMQRTDESFSLDRYKKHDIAVVIDSVDLKDTTRLADAVEQGLMKSGGLLIVLDKKGKEHLFSSQHACPVCGLSFPELQPRMFSFNSPFGACESCSGLGVRMDFDPQLIIPDKNLSLVDGAIAVYRNAIDGWRAQHLAAVAKHYGFDVFTPIKDLSEKQLKILLYGSDEKIHFTMSMKHGDANWSHTGMWEGLIPQCERLYQQTTSDYRRRELEKFMVVSPCSVCHGKRLNEKALAVYIANKNIIDVTELSIDEALSFFSTIALTDKEKEISKQILKEIRERLTFLQRVGLGYVTLSRAAGTLSGGEAQRIRLATQIGANLTGVLYILDEPSIGLHQKDNKKLIDTLKRLRDLGNTLVVVEHDEETIRNADFVVDMGPGAGAQGGKIVAKGTPKQIEKNPHSLTGKYLSQKLSIAVPSHRRITKNFLHVLGCTEHNLKNIDVHIPLGVLSVITGVSGSGKSTLLSNILYPALLKKLYHAKRVVGKYEKMFFDKPIDKVIEIDQSPIGRTPRSNPATYTKVFDHIRQLFALTKEAKIRGYKPGRFSFNVKGGRCEHCQGDGQIKIEMNFLPDVFVECEECHGTRYNKETLEVLYKRKSIADVLDMTVDEARKLFDPIPSIKNKLVTLQEVGLGYIKLGQGSNTLSGGEAQRIKLTRELAKRGTGSTLYLLDEPTTGLHFHDVRKLIGVLDSLVAKGNTVVIIEHNLDVIKSADYIIDLGPHGGDAGGEIVAKGTPEEVASCKKSFTGQFLKKLL